MIIFPCFWTETFATSVEHKCLRVLVNTVSEAAALGFLVGPCILYWDPSYAMMGLQARITHLLSLSNKLRKLFCLCLLTYYKLYYGLNTCLGSWRKPHRLTSRELKYHKEKSKAQAMTLAWKWLFSTQENINLIKVCAYLMRMLA